MGEGKSVCFLHTREFNSPLLYNLYVSRFVRCAHNWQPGSTPEKGHHCLLSRSLPWASATVLNVTVTTFQVTDGVRCFWYIKAPHRLKKKSINGLP